jgi:UDP-N-acetylmuramoyl-tripeptide--D-alanyl-D-alanine ligase
LVQPDYILFTGVCAQHVETFGSEEEVLHAKCEALSSSAKLVICGNALKERLEKEYPAELAKCRFVERAKAVQLRADGAAFILPLQRGGVSVDTCLLGEAAVENISLAAALAEVLGLTAEEIAVGVKNLRPTAHRLELTKQGGVYILDDAYNCNEKGAKLAIDALKRFAGKKYIITPGIVETGVLHEEINGRLGAMLAKAGLDMVVLVGETQAKVIIDGYQSAGGNMDALRVVPSLQDATALLQGRLSDGDCVLFMNDLPDCV